MTAHPAPAPAHTAIHVVSLADATERRTRFSERAQAAECDWSFYDAKTILWPGLFYDEQRSIAIHGRPLTRGEIGCYSSHFSLWEKLLTDTASQYIIIEDDAIVDWPAIKCLAERDLHGEGIDYVRLFHKFPSRLAVVRRDWPSHQKFLVDLLDRPYGTQAYIITRAGAEKFVACLRQVVRPVDDQMDRFWDHKVPNLCVYPFVVLEETGPSTIGTRQCTGRLGRLSPARRRSLLDRVRRELAGWRKRVAYAWSRHAINSLKS